MTILRVGTADGLHNFLDASGSDLASHEVTGLARDGRDWWALLDGSAVWRSKGNAGWRQISVSDGLRANCLLPTAGGLLVGTAEAHLLRLTDGRLDRLDSFDGVEGRENWYTPWGGPPDTRSLATGADGSIFANVHVGGIPKSVEEGATWEPTIDIDADVHQVIVQPEAPGTVFAACALGLGVSFDGGASWAFETEGLHATYSRAVAVAGETVLVSVSRGPRGGQAAVYRRPTSGGTFDRCRDGLPEWFADNIDSHRLAAAGPMAALGTDDGEVFLSTDEGGSWERVAGGLPAVMSVAFA